jgi:hypothetical protein
MVSGTERFGEPRVGRMGALAPTLFFACLCYACYGRMAVGCLGPWDPVGILLTKWRTTEQYPPGPWWFWRRADFEFRAGNTCWCTRGKMEKKRHSVRNGRIIDAPKRDSISVSTKIDFFRIPESLWDRNTLLLVVFRLCAAPPTMGTAPSYFKRVGFLRLTRLAS